MKDLRNYGDEVAREITGRGVEGSLSEQRYFEDLMKLVWNVACLEMEWKFAFCSLEICIKMTRMTFASSFGQLQLTMELHQGTSHIPMIS